MRHAALRCLALATCCALSAAAGGELHAQNRLTVSGFPIMFATPTGTEFAAGSIEAAAPFSFSVDAIGGNPNQVRTTTVSVRCELPCPAGGTKSVGSLQWRRADLGTWVPMTTTDVAIEQRLVRRNNMNDPWGNDVVFRFLLDWVADAPASSGSFNLVITLTVAAS